MNLFRKKPVVIEAMRYDATTYTAVQDWMARHGTTPGMGSQTRNYSPEYPEGWDYPTLEIPTLEGTMTASVGDWIIKGVKGEFYPCKPDIFEATYERVEAQTP
jgi:hypothetical protein